MSLVTIAVVSSGNFPLYLRDFVLDEESSQNSYGFSTTSSKNNNDGKQLPEEDPFGFFESQKSNLNDSSSLRNQVGWQNIRMNNCLFHTSHEMVIFFCLFQTSSVHNILYILLKICF